MEALPVPLPPAPQGMRGIGDHMSAKYSGLVHLLLAAMQVPTLECAWVRAALPRSGRRQA